MKKIIFIKLIMIIGFIHFFQINSFGQYASLKGSPLFKNEKQNIFRDSATNILYNISYMDSLYQMGIAPFQVISNIEKEDSIIWLIKFIDKEEYSIKSKWVNNKFPLKEFTDINNNQIKLNELIGKILIINCWSISCGPCIKEMPYLNALTDSLPSNKYAFLGITFDDNASINNFFKSDKLKKYLNTQSPSFNFKIIPNQEVLLSNILGIKSYPTTFIVDQNGIIKEIIEGLYLDDNKNPKVFSHIMEILKNI